VTRFVGRAAMASVALDALAAQGVAGSVVDDRGDAIEVEAESTAVAALLAPFGFRPQAGRASGLPASGSLPDLDDVAACVAWAAGREFKVEKVLRLDGRNPTAEEVAVVNRLGKKGMKQAIRLRAEVETAFAAVDGEETTGAGQ
jgi:hypothetical protein